MTDFQSAPQLYIRHSTSWMRYILDYNPLFLLSAVCMLVGCRLLTDAIDPRAGDVRGALWLILTINVYEFCLLGAAALIRKMIGMRRDVGILLIVAVIFLCDVTFVVGDLSTTRPGLGAFISILLIVLAGLKTWLAMWLLNAPKQWRTIAVMTLQLATLMLLPVVFARISGRHNGNLPPITLYAGWWIAGLVLVISRLVMSVRSDLILPGLGRAYLTIAYIAMLGHLWACAWVFKVPFHQAYSTPVLLGVAMLIGMSRDWFGRSLASALQWSIALWAVLLSMNAPATLAFGGMQHQWGAVSAFRLSCIAGALVHLHGLIVLHSPLFAATLAMGLSVALLGPTPQLALANIRELGQMAVRFIHRCIPRTNTQWGILTVATSFVLLGVGTVVSIFFKPKQVQNELTEVV